MEWIQENWVDIAAVLAGIHVLAVAIVNITPTPKDNEWVGKAYRWVEVLGGLITAKAKETNGT